MSDIDDELFALAGGDEEAEEGEASSVAASSPNSLGSGAMDESDSDRDDDPAPRDTSVPYPIEGKYVDEADRRRIESLPQLERERILGQRAEEAGNLKFQAELARRAKAMEAETAHLDKKKRKATSPEPEDSYRKSSRQKIKPTTSLEAYKQARQRKDQEQQRRDDRRRRRSTSIDRGESDVDAEGESEADYDDYSRQQAAREEQPAQLMHFEHVHSYRGYFGKHCFAPGFEDAMTGTYVKIGTGQVQGRTVYKMAVVKGFKEGKPYVFEGKDGVKVATDQYVIAKHGANQKEYNFTYISNQRFTEEDLITFKQALAESGGKFPTESQLKQKFQDMRDLETRPWTDADIDAKLKRKKKYAHLLSSHAKPAYVDPVAQRLAQRNAENRKQNQINVRKALVKERAQRNKEQKMAWEAAQKKKAEEEAKGKEKSLLAVPKAGGIDDLFEGSDRSRSATPAVARASTPKVERKGIPTFSKRKMDDDIISAMEFGIDIEI